MKKKLQKLIGVSLVFAIVFTTFACGLTAKAASGVIIEPEMEQGTIDKGVVMTHVGTRVHTKYFLLFTDYAGVKLKSGYKASYHFYDKDGNWLGQGNRWFEGDMTISQIRQYTSSKAVKFAIIIGTTNNDDLFLEEFPSDVLKLELAAGLTAPTSPQTPVFTGSDEPETPADGNVVSPKMAQGTIDKGVLYSGVTTRIHTEEMISLDEYEMVLVSTGYKLVYHTYDKYGNWLSGSSWIEVKDAQFKILTNVIQGNSPGAAYFRIIIGKLDNSNITPSEFSSNSLQIVRNADDYIDFKNEIVFEIGPNVNGSWQEGAIFDGKLFAFNHAEWGRVFDIETGEILGSFTGDRNDAFSVHSNSMCFSSQYYDKNDKYPLLYISVYNNYASQENRYEGHCGVYRIIEEGSDFKAELVQIIRIGFTEDLNLWKSLPNNGDVCPYGNFVVDSDKNDFYAFVMRDANSTTRFFKFDLPAVSEGEYDATFGCKMVTLNVGDIKDQFDTEYSVYLQGADYVNGLILSGSGLGYGNEGGAMLRVIDLESKTVIKTFDAVEAGVYREVEIIAVDPETKKVYYGATDGYLRELICMEEFVNSKDHVHNYSKSYSYDAENHWFDCATCDNQKDKAPHKYDNDCDSDCNVCGAKRNITHNYEWVIDSKPTCNKTGIKHQECSVCHDKQNENTLIEATGEHSYTNSFDASCNICGNIREISAQWLVEENGKTYYYLNGQKSTETGLFKIYGEWFYIENGVWMSDATTLVKYNGVWYYIESGKWTKTKTLVKYNGKWFYVENGVINWDAKTVVKYNGKWYYVKNGKWNKSTTLCKYNGTWYYIKNGKIDFKATTLVKYKGTWYYVKSGKKNTSTTLCKYGSKYYYVKKGKKSTATAIVKYKGKKYYVKKGIAQTSFSGKVKIGSTTYKIKNGKVI